MRCLLTIIMLLGAFAGYGQKTFKPSDISFGAPVPKPNVEYSFSHLFVKNDTARNYEVSKFTFVCKSAKSGNINREVKGDLLPADLQALIINFNPKEDAISIENISITDKRTGKVTELKGLKHKVNPENDN